LPLPSALERSNSYGPLAALVTTPVSPGYQLLLHPPSSPALQPVPPQEPPSTATGTPSKTSPRMKFLSPAAPAVPASPFAAATPAAAASKCTGSRFAPAAPPRALLQRGACGGGELRANVGRYRRLCTSMSGLAGEASSMSDGAVCAAGSVLDSVGFAGGDCARVRFAGCSLDGRVLVGGRMASLPAGGGAAAFAAAMAGLNASATQMTGE
jgi:hypothetical protein